MKFRPLQDRLLVECIEEQQTAGGIVLPDSAKEKPTSAKVIAVGAGKMVDGNRVPLEVKVGDVISFGKYAGTEITLDGKTYTIINESDVLGVHA